MKKILLIIILISTVSCAYKPLQLKSQDAKTISGNYCFMLSESVSDQQSVYSIVPKEYQDKYDDKKQLRFNYNFSDFIRVSDSCDSNGFVIQSVSNIYKMIGDTGQAAHQITLEIELASNSVVMENAGKIKITERSPYYSSFTHTKKKKQKRISQILTNVFDKLILELER